MGVQMTAGEDIAIRRKRLRYRAWHRGTKEMDLILGPFADANVEAYDEAALDRLESLMEEPPAHVDVEFLNLVIADHQSRIEK